MFPFPYFLAKVQKRRGEKGGGWSNVIVVIIGNVGVVQETLDGKESSTACRQRAMGKRAGKR